jgi:riboflavin transporter FmnP
MLYCNSVPENYSRGLFFWGGFLKKTNLKKLSVASMLTAVAFLCTFVFRFKVAFLTFDFKDAVISIISLLYGPLYGVASAAIVAFFEMLSMSDTGIYGMIMNFLSSGTFALTCGIIYKYKRSFCGAIIAVISSIISVTTVMMIANIFITPHYLGTTSAEVMSYIPTLLLPFNLAKSVVNASVVLIIYKPVTNALRRIGLIKKSEQEGKRITLKIIILIVISLAVLALAIAFILIKLGGSFEVFRL